jgi:hypothetical protein
VPKGALMLNRGAFDSMLALSDDEAAWHVRHDCGEYSIGEDKVESTWHPFADVTVHTVIIPLGDWHIRVHRITTPRKLFAAEGGYAVRREEGTTPAQTGIDGLKAFAASGELFSGVVGLRGFASAQIVTPEPNTNLFYPRTLLPTLRAELPQGETVLVSAVLGAAEDGFQKWQSCPKEAASYADLCK